MTKPETSFLDVPQTPRGHLALLFYAAAYSLIRHLRWRAANADKTLDDVFTEFPFLVSYFSQIRSRLPDEINWDESIRWLGDEIHAWEETASTWLPLRALEQRVGVRREALIAFVMVGLVEEEAHFGALFAAIQQPEGFRRPTVGLVGSVIGAETADHRGDGWDIVRPLVDGGFLEPVSCDAPRAEWLLRVPTAVWSAVRGDESKRPFPGVRHRSADACVSFSDLVLAPRLTTRLEEARRLLESGQVRSLVVRGMPGSDRVAVVEAVARGLSLGVVELEAAPPPGVGAFCTLMQALPVFCLDLGPGETFAVPPLPGYAGPYAVAMGREGGLSGAPQAVAFDLVPETAAQRLALWKTALGARPADDLPEIAARFALPARYVRQCAALAADHAALERREVVTSGDVRHATRVLNRQVIDSLATRLDGEVRWPQLIVDAGTRRELHLLEERCRHRERLAAMLGEDFPGGLNVGVRALLEGPSGVGKTLAARVLACELGLDLYRVDLAAVVNKYIGETEKNLSRVLSRAEDLNVILLLDEGDALMTRRTDVKSANDRYANLETNYLLQRLETYGGIVFVTTNAGQHIDSAFRRRMDAVIRFHIPDGGERWRLWTVHLPPDHTIPAEALEEIALRYALSGGQIRQCVVRAALLAAGGNGGRISLAHLEGAIEVEHRTSGTTYARKQADVSIRNDDSLAAFLGEIS